MIPSNNTSAAASMLVLVPLQAATAYVQQIVVCFCFSLVGVCLYFWNWIQPAKTPTIRPPVVSLSGSAHLAICDRPACHFASILSSSFSSNMGDSYQEQERENQADDREPLTPHHLDPRRHSVPLHSLDLVASTLQHLDDVWQRRIKSFTKFTHGFLIHQALAFVFGWILPFLCLWCSSFVASPVPLFSNWPALMKFYHPSISGSINDGPFLVVYASGLWVILPLLCVSYLFFVFLFWTSQLHRHRVAGAHEASLRDGSTATGDVVVLGLGLMTLVVFVNFFIHFCSFYCFSYMFIETDLSSSSSSSLHTLWNVPIVRNWAQVIWVHFGLIAILILRILVAGSFPNHCAFVFSKITMGWYCPFWIFAFLLPVMVEMNSWSLDVTSARPLHVSSFVDASASPSSRFSHPWLLSQNLASDNVLYFKMNQENSLSIVGFCVALTVWVTLMFRFKHYFRWLEVQKSFFIRWSQSPENAL